MINFISNLPSGLRTGGFSALNAAAFETLSKVAPVRYVGPIDPPAVLSHRLASKLLRTMGVAADFPVFSRQRLDQIAQEVTRRTNPDATVDFFHGFTPWIQTQSERAYIAWSDCTFHDYIDIYHIRRHFRADDIERIEQTEAEWLRRASRVLFTSRWSADRAIAEYRLDPQQVECVGMFGETVQPEYDAYDGGRDFLFISTNFDAKGGRVVVEAYRLLRRRHPDAALIVVGDAPDWIRREDGVQVTGVLRKECPVEHDRLRGIVARARALVHPTRSDICPLSIVEAGYFGCPAIATRAFAIPELVDHQRSGVLLEDPSNVGAVADAMAGLLESGNEYTAMRAAAWKKMRDEYSRTRFDRRLSSLVPAA